MPDTSAKHRRGASALLRRCLRVPLLLTLMGTPAAWGCAQNTYLAITNLSSYDITNTKVSGVDNYDWDQARPDKNFQNQNIPVGESLSKPEDMNCKAASSWFTMTLTFKNGSTLTFRNDQKDARKNFYRIYYPKSGNIDKYTLVQFSKNDKNYFAVLPKMETDSWMGLLPNDTPLTTLTIPGTHDTAAFKDSITTYARTQNKNFTQQLDDGIRFFDIRVRRVPGPAWALHHGPVYLHLNFQSVLNALKSFFASHPTETVIMSIKQDYDPMDGVTATMSETFWRYEKEDPSLWYLGTSLPRLGQARGKIILLRRYLLRKGETPYGIDASNWPDNSAFTISDPPDLIHVQDRYKAGGKDKADAVNRTMASARDNSAINYTYINFVSSNTGSCLNIPRRCANDVMPLVRKTPIVRPSKTRLGIIPMDFYSDYGPFVPVLLGTNKFP